MGTLAALVFSFVMTQILPSLHSPEAWPMVDLAVIFNLVLDGFAILPQVMLITKTDKSTKDPGMANTASSFLGLLCLGRALRMIFWIVVRLSDPTNNVAIWTFVVPDLVHTIIMGDYLYLWLQKIKRDRLDPFVHDVINL